jgi:hypothetical protein
VVAVAEQLRGREAHRVDRLGLGGQALRPQVGERVQPLRLDDGADGARARTGGRRLWCGGSPAPVRTRSPGEKRTLHLLGRQDALLHAQRADRRGNHFS